VLFARPVSNVSLPSVESIGGGDWLKAVVENGLNIKKIEHLRSYCINKSYSALFLFKMKKTIPCS
jgi:hypothetical protein